jgi:hypothetical protein
MIMANSAVENDLVDRLAAYPGCAEPDVRILSLRSGGDAPRPGWRFQTGR